MLLGRIIQLIMHRLCADKLILYCPQGMFEFDASSHSPPAHEARTLAESVQTHYHHRVCIVSISVPWETCH